MDRSDLEHHLEQLHAESDRLRAVAADAAPLRIRHELQTTTDEPLRQLLLQAQRGELPLREVLASADYQRARDAGELPDPEDAPEDGLSTALGQAVQQLRAEVERVEAEQSRAAEDAAQEQFRYRPRISDR